MGSAHSVRLATAICAVVMVGCTQVLDAELIHAEARQAIGSNSSALVQAHEIFGEVAVEVCIFDRYDTPALTSSLGFWDRFLMPFRDTHEFHFVQRVGERSQSVHMVHRASLWIRFAD